jgi:hypothetical protein
MGPVGFADLIEKTSTEAGADLKRRLPNGSPDMKIGWAKG